MPEGLPPHLDEEKVNNAVDFYHNWLYSVVPADDRTEDWVSGELIINYTANIYLAGYCRNCGQAFTEKLPRDIHYNTVTQLRVPKLGCVAP